MQLFNKNNMFFKSTYFFVFVFFIFLTGESSSSTTALDLQIHIYRKWNVKLTVNEILLQIEMCKMQPHENLLLALCNKKSPQNFR